MSAKKLFFQFHVLPFLLLLFISVLIFLLSGSFLPGRPPEDLATRIVRLESAGQYAETLPLYVQRLQRDPLNIDLHYAYIQNYFKVYPKDGHREEHRKLTGQYEAYAKNASTADIGYFGLGLIQALSGDDEQALSDFQNVKNRHLKYLNNALGDVYLNLNEKDRAVEYYKREIAGRGDLAQAVSELVRIYREQNQLEKIQILLADRQTASFVNFSDRRQLARQSGDWFAYLDLTFLKLIQQASLNAVLAAVLVGSVWFVFLRRIDVFHPQPLPILALMLLLGMSSAPGSLVLGDFAPKLLTFLPKGSWYRDLLGSVLYTGVIEELAKFLPVLLIASLVRPPKEPFDLMALGAASAVGFAIFENSLYFTRDGLGLVFTRFLYSSVMHLAMTAIVCYSWAKALAFQKRNRILQVSKGLLLAALVHGLFDHFLLTPDKRLSALSIFLVFVMISEYYRMIRNTLAFSPTFHSTAEISRRLTNFGLLSCATLGLLMIVFLYNRFTVSTAFARGALPPLILVSLPEMIILLGSLGKFELSQGEWAPFFNYKKRWERLVALRDLFPPSA